MHQWVQSPGLKGFVGWFISRRENYGKKGKLKYGCSRKYQTGPESKRGCFAQIIQRTSMDFCIKLNIILLLTSPNFGGSFKGIFK